MTSQLRFPFWTFPSNCRTLQLAKEIGVRQASAWFLLHRLREACGPDLSVLRGTVVVDEVYLGGKEQNKHMKQGMYGDQGIPSNTAVVVMRELGKGGGTRALPVENVGGIIIQNTVRQNVEAGS